MRIKLSKFGRPLFAAFTLAAITLVLSIASPKRVEGGSTVAVQVTNSTVPVDTERPARTPFQINFFDNGTGVGSFTVPGQNRLVIEFVSAHCETPGQQVTGMNISTSVLGGPFVNHYLQPAFNGGSNGTSRYTVSELTRIYADGGTDVGLSTEFAGAQIDCIFEVGGYLIRP